MPIPLLLQKLLARLLNRSDREFSIAIRIFSIFERAQERVSEISKIILEGSLSEFCFCSREDMEEREAGFPSGEISHDLKSERVCNLERSDRDLGGPSMVPSFHKK